MTTEHERDRLADELARMPVHELVDVLRRVLPRYSERSDGPEAIERTLVMATAIHSADEPDAIDVQLVAWPDRDHYDGGIGPDQGLWEDGWCQKCETNVVSNAKRAFCPVCGGRCSLT